MPPPEQEVSASELYELAAMLSRQFIQRRDMYPVQLPDGRYVTHHEPLEPRELVKHVQGYHTLGTYLLDAGSHARFVVLDADTPEALARLQAAIPALTHAGAPAYLESSRRGGHLWLFFAQPVSGDLARRFANGIATQHQLSEVEIYPKQAVLHAGPGSLIRLPFGVHRLTGKRYAFRAPDGRRLAPTIREQIRAMAYPETVKEWAFSAYVAVVDGMPEQKPMVVTPADAETVSGRLKGSVTVLEFVSQYVSLNGRHVGLCPFHEDHKESFAVNDRENYWNCFSGCGGGSIIDFWMRRQNCDFTTAVTELARIVL